MKTFVLVGAKFAGLQTFIAAAVIPSLPNDDLIIVDEEIIRGAGSFKNFDLK